MSVTATDGSSIAAPKLAAWILMIVYTLNFMDRQVLSVLLPQIQAEFHIGDAQAGLLHGTAFALFYVTLALPIARWADVGNRVRIIAAATLVWGAMTAICGFARSFPMLFLARVGVGVGEAGCSPAAYSLLSAYYPLDRRAGAMAIYGAGIPLGGAMGLAFGGVLAQFFGWRDAFLFFGIPSILASVLVLATLREPARDLRPQAARPSMGIIIRELWVRPAFRHATIATALLAFAGFGAAAWAPSFLIRSQGMPIAYIGLALAGITILGAVPATLAAGRVADSFARRDPRILMRLPAIAMIVATPFSILALLLPRGSMALFGLSVPSFAVVVLLLAVPTAAAAVYIGPVLAAIQSMVAEGQRATTIAIFLFVTNLVGLGAGPYAIGLLSDLLRRYSGAQSLRWSLLLTVAINLWAAFHFWRAGKFVANDLGPETLRHE